MSHDTIVHRIVRPVIRLAAKTPVKPDHLTALRFITAVAAGLAFSVGWIWQGSLIFLLSAFLDRADGELARQTKIFSQHGHRYDLIADWSAGAITFAGLGFGEREGMLGLWALLLGVLAAVGVTVLFWGINVRAAPALPRYAGASGRVVVDPDDGMFLIPPLLWLIGADGVLLLAGIVTPGLACLVLLRLRRAARGQANPDTLLGPGAFQ